MSDPLVFEVQSPRFALPFLFAGQAQKDFFVNEALSRLDAALHPVIEGTSSSAPTDPGEGDAWIVGPDASGDWASCTDKLASYIGGQWIFVAPQAGMLVFDRTTGMRRIFSNGWIDAPSAAEPTGGNVIDQEARAAIAAIVAAMTQFGLMSST